MNSTSQITVQPNIYWPKNIDEIKITKKEKRKLRKIIIKTFSEISLNEENVFVFKNIDRRPSPRRLVISQKNCFVILNTHGGMPQFNNNDRIKRKITYVWNCFSGEFWFKRELTSPLQKDCINFLAFSKDIGYSYLAFPKMSLDPLDSKLRYFEEALDIDLPNWLKSNSNKMKYKSFRGLLDALRKIHCVTLKTNRFLYKGVDGYISFSPKYTLFHGNISPNKIYCKKIRANGKIIPRLILTDFYSIGSLKNLFMTPGWSSPECIKYSITKSEYQDLHLHEFLAAYGAKKDAWVIGLMIASLLRGGFHRKYTTALPSFSFITNKLKFNENDEIDESGLINLTQEEINLKIEECIQSEADKNLKSIWECIKFYLIIDPNERHTCNEAYIGHKLKWYLT